ncbi:MULTISPECIES: YbjN domain-containing protein [unclassified Amycolatopsis]|uniref:YbjN domain-containing protein n=1 Tax=unclassified Amycolatopsis TaxID=2618356 RepID=UPI001C6A830A|nr:YbjN domain-containing protein [Amycolatopsis sp. DSM 110486]QYN21541.1 YbjN domain-containing protein [Amycolatopsis sp. DSM 110486]
MSTSEAAETAALLGLAREALERYLDVNVDDDGAITFRHAEVPCVIQATRLADGLTVLSLTCVVAWDLPDNPAIAVAVAERAGQGLFGTLGVGHTDSGVDVTLRYAFPAEGMDPSALGTLLMLVVSTASQLRTELPGLD